MTSFRDLRVYQKLKTLHLEVHGESLAFPKFEMYELGSHENYDHCGRMLERLHQSLSEWHGSVRTGHVVKEDRADYIVSTDDSWLHAVRITLQIMDELR